MESTLGLVDELNRLRDIEREYRITLRALAIVTERLLVATKSHAVEISDSAIESGPDLRAWRDEARRGVVITVER